MSQYGHVGSYALGIVAATRLAVGNPIIARANEGPCDIYAAGGTSCVAAHSTTRALYGDYEGPLYQLTKGSDNSTKNIHPLSAGGVAKATDQDDFCSGSTCTISIIYDQSGNGNHLTQAPGGGAAQGPEVGGNDYLAGAFGAPVTLNGQKAYGMFGSPMTGFRNDKPNRTATGDDAESIYAIFDGTHYDAKCCFDYGNAETDNTDPGDGHMEAVYFGAGDGWSGKGTGDGPWVMADLENYLYSGFSHGVNDNPSQTAQFVVGIVKGEPNHWAIRGGDATSGQLDTYYDGIRPTDKGAGGYNPMRKEGAIVLGVGGDNSDGSQGTFYEGVMTTGYPSDDTEAKVMANIKAAGYGQTDLNIGTPLTIGKAISLQATSPCCTTRYLSHDGETVNTQVVSSSDSDDLKKASSWTVRTGLGNNGCFSLESVDQPGSFIRHSSYELKVDENDGSKQFGEDATFCSVTPGINGKGSTLRSWSYAARYIRHYASVGYIASNGGPHAFDHPRSFNDDISWDVRDALAST